MRRKLTPIKGAYWVRNNLVAGEYLREWNERKLRARLRQLLQAGVTLFLDLTQEREKNLRPYARSLRKEAAAAGRVVEYRRMPVPDFDTPMVEQMRRILDVLDGAVASGHIAYVHCYAGLGRTGTVVGCYLVRHGMDGQAALEELVHLRCGTDLEGYASPVTDEQRQMVLDWAALEAGDLPATR
jgi:protein tyrosine/serine phosphatase